MSIAAMVIGAPGKAKSRTQWVPWYTNAVTAIGLGIVIDALLHVATAWSTILLFAGAAAIAELTSVELFANSRVRISVSSIVAIAAILIFGPLAGVLVHLTSGLMTVITTTLMQRQMPREQHRASLWRRSAFNMSMWVIAAALAGWIYVQTGGAPNEVIRWGNVLPLVLAVIADALANIILLIGVISLQTGRNVIQIWRQDFQWGMPIAILGGVIGGGGLALGFEELGLTGLAIFMLPVLATGYAFHLYVHNTRAYVNQLEEMNQSLAQELAERKQAEAVIRQQISMMENSIDGIALLDANGVYLYVNHAYAYLHGRKHAQEMIGQSWHGQYDQAERDYLEQVVYPILLREGKWRGELVGLRADGGAFRQEMSMVRLGNDKFTYIVRDITERKKTEEALHRSQKLESLGLLAGGVAHDFNNVLVGILGQASLARAKLPADSPAASHLEKAIVASTRASDLTRQLLIYAGKDKVQVKPFHVNGLLAENKGLFEAIVPKRVELTFDLSQDLPSIEGDIGQIQQVLMNLIMNASEAIGARNGHVWVQSSRCVITEQSTDTGAEYISSGSLAPGNYVSVIVKDDGAGMDKTTLDRIFDPFFSTKGSGRGLGLSATLGIIHQHKGSLGVTSQPGKGTTFRVLLPALMAMDAEIAVAPAMNESTAPMAGTVLVVDDEAIVRDVFGEALRTNGLKVLKAENGRQGLDLFRARQSDISLIVLDMQMPVMGGAETLQEVLAMKPDMRIILTSGYSDWDQIESAIRSPSVVFLQKPYPVDTLIKTVREQLRHLESRQPIQRSPV